MHQFKFLPAGRTGTIEYTDAGKLLVIPCEMSGVPHRDILLGPVDLQKWDEPAGEEIPEAEQMLILGRLRAWLADQGFRSDIDLPEDIEETEERCHMGDCQKRAIKDSMFCLEHVSRLSLRR